MTAVDLVLSILDADRRLLSRDDIIAIAERALEGARLEERERIEQIVNDAARSYSPANAVDEETRDFLTGAESCARRILAAIPPPTQE